MNKRIRTLVIIIVAIALLVASLLAVLLIKPGGDGSNVSTEPTATTPDLSVVLFDKTKDSAGSAVSKPLKKALVRLEAEAFTIQQSEDEELAVEAYRDLPVNATALSTFQTNISSMTAVQQVASFPVTTATEGAGTTTTDAGTTQTAGATTTRASASADEPTLASFGLDSPQAVITATYHDDEVIQLDIGGEAPTGDGYYLRVAGKPEVYLVSTYTVESLLRESLQYIGTTMVTAPSVASGEEGTAALYGAAFGGRDRGGKGKNEVYRMRIREQSDDPDLSNFSYILTYPHETGVDLDKSTTLSTLTSMTAIQAEKAHPTAEDLARYGLDDPFATLELTLAIKKTVDEKDSYSGQTTYKIRLGNKHEDGYYYAMTDAVDVVYRLEASTAESWAGYTWTDLRAANNFLIGITTVSEVIIDIEGKRTVFALEHRPDTEEETLIVTSGGKSYPAADFRNLYKILMQSSSTADTADAPTGDPTVTVTLKRVTGEDKEYKERVCQYYKLNAIDTLCVGVDGDAFLMLTDSLNWLIKQTGNYLNGQPVIDR